MPRTNAPITSFGIELQAVLREGANRHVHLKFDTPKLVIRFTQRIHQLRKAMKEAKHPDWQNLYRCAVYQDPNDPCVLIVGPKDSEFRAVIAAAGITVPDPAPVTEVDIQTAPGTVDDFLSDLTSLTSVHEMRSEDTDEEPSLDNL